MNEFFSYSKNKLDVFIPFTKIDGVNRRVWAYLTTGDLDHDGQRVDMKAIARALPEYLEWGNVREMHEKKVAGVIQPENAMIDDYGLLGGIDVLRDDTWQLIEGGGYKGVSIGLSDVVIRKSDDAPHGLLTDGGEGGKPFKIIEASFVDRPANPKCKIVALKVMDDGKVLLDGIKAVEKLDAPRGKGIVPPEQTPAAIAPAAGVASPSGQAIHAPAETQKMDMGFDANSGVVATPSFAAAWTGKEMQEDLPDMLDCLYGVISSIAWGGYWSPEQKRAGMQMAVGEFADKCGEYMTGTKLAEASVKKLAAQTVAWNLQVHPEGIETAPEVKTTTAVLKLEDLQSSFTKEVAALKADTEKKLGEAVSKIGELVEQKTALEARVKTLEETPLPAKGIKNADAILTNKGGGDGGPDEMAIITGKLAEMARSKDAATRQAAATFGAALYKDIMLGGQR